MALYSVGAFLLYVAGAVLLGDTFPFSRFSMYADYRRQGAVPVFLAGGRPVSVRAFESFFGIDPDRMYPKGTPCSLEWRIHEARRWIVQHTASGPMERAVPVQWGFTFVTVDEAGRVRQDVRIVSEGVACPRS
jgi:hypothetical protein